MLLSKPIGAILKRAFSQSADSSDSRTRSSSAAAAPQSLGPPSQNRSAPDSRADSRIPTPTPRESQETTNPNTSGEQTTGLHSNSLLSARAFRLECPPTAVRARTGPTVATATASATAAAPPTVPDSVTGLSLTVKPSVDAHTLASEPPRQRKHSRIHRLTIYETNTRFYIVGSDVRDLSYRVLSVHRDSPAKLVAEELAGAYDKSSLVRLLSQIDRAAGGNGLLEKKRPKNKTGLIFRCRAWALLGFIRFTGAYYMVLVMKRLQAAVIGGHMVYQVDGTEMVPVVVPGSDAEATTRSAMEGRYLGILGNADLSQNFYFSYGYDVTRTLQHNITVRRRAAQAESTSDLAAPKANPDDEFTVTGSGPNEMFVWNAFLMEPLTEHSEWCVPIIHGFVGQVALDVMGRKVHIALVARRSRHYAGARFLRRGINAAGHVANDVETEQIVADLLTTPLHVPGSSSSGAGRYANNRYSSFVQHRGSIPLRWSQRGAGVSPKPAIVLDAIDPFYQAAARHFDDLFSRYGTPICVLNLVKSKERVPRESLLSKEYESAIRYLNQSLPDENKIGYRAFDMSRAAKTRGGNVVSTLEEIADTVVDQTGFFLNGETKEDGLRVQNGVARTNCIDCLDRTNAAQFVIAKCALGRQLQALGVLENPELDYDSRAISAFSRIFHDHGDTIATQYGGSYLVNTMATYRKTNAWAASRDMVESFKRYYANSFTDPMRQQAYDLFLGQYRVSGAQESTGRQATVESPGGSSLGGIADNELDSGWARRSRHYYHWYTPRHLERREIPASAAPNSKFLAWKRSRRMSEARQKVSRRLAPHLPTNDNSDDDSDYFTEYYRPQHITTMSKLFAFRLIATNRYLHDTERKGENGSPFVLEEEESGSEYYADGGSDTDNDIDADAIDTNDVSGILNFQAWTRNRAVVTEADRLRYSSYLDSATKKNFETTADVNQYVQAAVLGGNCICRLNKDEEVEIQYPVAREQEAEPGSEAEISLDRNICAEEVHNGAISGGTVSTRSNSRASERVSDGQTSKANYMSLRRKKYNIRPPSSAGTARSSLFFGRSSPIPNIPDTHTDAPNASPGKSESGGKKPSWPWRSVSTVLQATKRIVSGFRPTDRKVSEAVHRVEDDSSSSESEKSTSSSDGESIDGRYENELAVVPWGGIIGCGECAMYEEYIEPDRDDFVEYERYAHSNDIIEDGDYTPQTLDMIERFLRFDLIGSSQGGIRDKSDLEEGTRSRKSTWSKGRPLGLSETAKRPFGLLSALESLESVASNETHALPDRMASLQSPDAVATGDAEVGGDDDSVSSVSVSGVYQPSSWTKDRGNGKKTTRVKGDRASRDGPGSAMPDEEAEEDDVQLLPDMLPRRQRPVSTLSTLSVEDRAGSDGGFYHHGHGHHQHHHQLLRSFRADPHAGRRLHKPPSYSDILQARPDGCYDGSEAGASEEFAAAAAAEYGGSVERMFLSGAAPGPIDPLQRLAESLVGPAPVRPAGPEESGRFLGNGAAGAIELSTSSAPQAQPQPDSTFAETSSNPNPNPNPKPSPNPRKGKGPAALPLSLSRLMGYVRGQEEEGPRA